MFCLPNINQPKDSLNRAITDARLSPALQELVHRVRANIGQSACVLPAVLKVVLFVRQFYFACIIKHM